MKYRIVETKDANGRSWFRIQEKWLWWWQSLGIAEIYGFCGHTYLDYKCFRFDSRENAESALKRVIKEYSYKGVPIYPTIDPNEFYVKKWKKEADLPVTCYDYFIYGSYEYCCKEIDRELKAKEMRKFKKITDVNIDEI